MKRFIGIMVLLVIIVLTACGAYAAQDVSKLVDIRNRIFEQSKEVKILFSDTKNVVLLSSMWDSCLMTISQIDAYFYMIGITNTIKDKDLSIDAIDLVLKWLDNIKKTNDLNISSLNAVKLDLDAKTRHNILEHNERVPVRSGTPDTQETVYKGSLLPRNRFQGFPGFFFRVG